jgi:hypothetical protein
MRVYAIALAVMLTAQPAWAHHKPNHPGFPRTPSAVQIARYPCGVSHAPRQNPGIRALVNHCRRLLAQYRASPTTSSCAIAAIARPWRVQARRASRLRARARIGRRDLE